MSITLDQLHEAVKLSQVEEVHCEKLLRGKLLTVEEFLKVTEHLDSSDICPKCKEPFDTHSDELQYTIDNIAVCSDCYFESLGDFVEQNPIWNPRLNRGV